MDVGTRAMQEHIAGPSYFKGVTINTKMRLEHDFISSLETRILKWLGYINKANQLLLNYCCYKTKVKMSC
ncbi:hypothetical protein CJF42_09600 [Pseudoalteromonas sp. NBT06-2]|nr:hypothetical protein CJF42_09600 [Pseudoalteromonas sp. NBT06-2]